MTSSSSPPPPVKRRPARNARSPEQIRIFYSRWFNEDSLVNQRLTWLLIAQALLFAAHGTVATKVVDACKEKAEDLSEILTVISFVGPTLATIVFLGIAAAVTAQYILHSQRQDPTASIGVNTYTTLAGWTTALLVPVVFFSSWLYLPKPTIADHAASCSVEHKPLDKLSILVPASAGTASGPAPKASAPSTPPTR